MDPIGPTDPIEPIKPIYPIDPVQPPQHPPQIYRLRTPNSPTSPKICRDIVALLLQATGHPQLADTARLLVSEVVTNVHLHTASPAVGLETIVRHDRVHVSVYDDAPDTDDARPQPANAHAESGRGLLLLDGLAQDWGVSQDYEHRVAGKRVWFELRNENGQ